MDATTTNRTLNGVSNKIFDQMSNAVVNGSLTERGPGALTRTTNETSTEALNGASQGNTATPLSNRCGKVALVK
ncbi:hypothetical protein MMC22_012093 [Lobaria immixta]|nr:hypothetical protein [Lobaria immixta]